MEKLFGVNKMNDLSKERTMKKKIRDLTKEELERYLNSYNYVSSYKDNEKSVESIFMLKDRYLYSKPILSDEFLNTEIDIPDKHILDKEEHDYLRAVCKPFKVKFITLNQWGENIYYLKIVVEDKITSTKRGVVELPYFTKGAMYKGMKWGKEYSVEELELDKEWGE